MSAVWAWMTDEATVAWVVVATIVINAVALAATAARQS